MISGENQNFPKHPNFIFDPVSLLILDLLKFVWLVKTWCNEIHHQATDFLACQLPHSQPPAWVCWSFFNLFRLAPTPRRSAQLFLSFFFVGFHGLGDNKKNTSNILQSSFLGFVAKIFGQKSGDFFFNFFQTDRPEKERDEFMTYRILLSLELFARRLGRRSVSPEQSVLRRSVPGVCFLGWVLVLGMMVFLLVEFWDEFVPLFPFGFLSVGKKRIPELTW